MKAPVIQLLSCSLITFIFEYLRLLSPRNAKVRWKELFLRQVYMEQKPRDN